jgi:glucan-binding YG repeat protein
MNMKHIKALKTGTAVVLALGIAAVTFASGSRDARFYLASETVPQTHNPNPGAETAEPAPTPEEQAADKLHKQQEQQTGTHKPHSTDQETAPTQSTTPTQ